MRLILLAGPILTSLALAEAPPSANAQKNDPTVVVESCEKNLEKTPHFKGLDPSFLAAKPIEDIEAYKQEIAAQNPNHKELWSKRAWNLAYYNQKNLPVIIKKLQDPESFSKKHNGVGLRFLDLPLYMPSQGWRIPPELEQFKEVIALAVNHERAINPNFEKDHYVYITVDQGVAPPHKSQRRPGWHGDSYRRKDALKINKPTDNLYVIADNCPTIFVEGPFDLTTIDATNADAVLSRLEDTARTQKPITYPDYTLLKMDPYCVHDAGVNNTDKPIDRTFVKISVSKTKYCKLGNAHNQLFKYDWPMVPRHNVPYSKDAIKDSAHRKDRDHFEEIDTSLVDFTANACDVPWAKPEIFSCYKTALVRAEPADMGDIIETRDDSNIITTNVAEKGDWKVFSTQEDVYFMSDARFQQAYEKHPQQKDHYTPKKNIRRAVELTKDVRLKGPWGTWQYATTGDYLVYVDTHDVHAVPKKLFEETYKVVE